MIRINNFAALTVPFAVIILSICFVHANFARAEFILGTPVNFGPVINSASSENTPFLSHDGLTLYFNSGRQGGLGDIWSATRDSIESEWNQPEGFTAINTPWAERSPFISSDGLTFLYAHFTVPGAGNNIYQLTRDLPKGPWGPPRLLPGPINDVVSPAGHPFMSSDSLTLLFARHDDNRNEDIWEAVRASLGDSWITRKLGINVNTPAAESSPVMAADGLTLLFSSDRPNGEGNIDIWMTERDTVFAEWEPATNLGPTINTPGQERPSQLWEPGNLMLFKSGSNAGPPGLLGEGASDLFYVTVVPEPSTGAMSICGVLLLAGFVRMRLKRSR